MDEFVVADVDPDVTELPSRVEEEKIPLDQLIARHTEADMGLLEGRPGEVDVEELIDLFHESRTVEPLHRGAAQAVGGAEETHRHLDEQLRFLRVVPVAEELRALLLAPLDLGPGRLR